MTPAQIAAISAALTAYLEAEDQVALAKPVNPWGWAARHEVVGAAVGICAPNDLPPQRPMG